MKRSFLALAICGFLLCSSDTFGQTVDEIISKHNEARGGLDKIHTLNSMRMEGVLIQNGTEVGLTFQIVHDKAIKVEFSVMGQSGYNIVTKTEGWSFNPFAGNTAAEPITPEQLKDGQTQLDLQGPLVDYAAKGNKVEYLGKENLQGADFYKIKLTRPDGKVITYYIDKDFLLNKTITTAFFNGSEQEVTTEFSDYRKTPEGLFVAYKRITPNGEINFEKIEINPTLADSVFKPNN